MSDNGQQNGEREVLLNSDELMTAIVRYLTQKNIKYGAGLEIEWVIMPEEGHQLPPIRDIAMRCKLGQP